MRVGIIGSGNIASQMAATINQVDGVELYAVASRTEPKAKDFAEKFGASCYYGNYEDLANDKNVDLVYIATPHATHYENTMLCLRHGKAVLCEKPFTLNYSQAESLIQHAEENKIFLSEAMWVRFQPFAKKIPELIAEGVIGEPRLVIVNKGEINNIGPSDVDQRLGGSALLGNGVYSLTAASLALGTDVVKTDASGIFMENGTDGAVSFNLIFGNNTMAHLSASLIANEHNAWYVCGSEGIMEIRGVSRLLTIDIYNNKRELVKHYDAPKMISGYEYELLACKKALESDALECSEMPHSETLRIMKLLDELRGKAGIVFSGEDA